MKKYIINILGFAVVVLILQAFSVAEYTPESVKKLARDNLRSFVSHPIIAQAVHQSNALKRSLDQIKSIDRDWIDTQGLNEFMQSILDNDCSKHLREIQAAQPYLAEIFVVDNQGAIACMTQRTSDFWQGDEKKFTDSFNNGAGKISVSEVHFDQSTQTYSTHVSIPIVDKPKTIGVFIFGVNIDRIE